MENFWACEENALRSYLDAMSKVDVSQIDAAALTQSKPDILAVSEDGKSARVSVVGMLKNSPPSFLEAIFGIKSTSYRDIAEAVALADADKDIETIYLDVNSPGGTVDGVEQAASVVAGAKTKVVAINHGLVASAAYWLASQADEIYATSPVDRTGSIGVVLTMQKDNGPYIDIVSSNAPNKRPDVSSDKGKAEVVRQLDSIERVFVSRVAAGRGVTEETVKKKFGQGGLLIAGDPDKSTADAVSAGMIDGLITSKAASAARSSKMEERLQELERALAAEKAKCADLEGRISAASKYLNSEYPDAVSKLAVEVLKGEATADLLRGAVIAFDAMASSNVATAAAEDSVEAGDVATMPKVDENDIDAEVKRTLQAMGRG